ncbi:hypothetical protein EVAR_71142_1 [Eumeta japonica]|uniref:Uncharacterized protein n=1 Tax=Eumeta variegata TaxID=151549 RepID=A0A4C2ADI6_EUMVA|nr:hypothetical protein EVAR_71142_1 [Eumeta japonica]
MNGHVPECRSAPLASGANRNLFPRVAVEHSIHRILQQKKHLAILISFENEDSRIEGGRVSELRARCGRGASGRSSNTLYAGWSRKLNRKSSETFARSPPQAPAGPRRPPQAPASSDAATRRSGKTRRAHRTYVDSDLYAI